jgi:hypothetical protein
MGSSSLVQCGQGMRGSLDQFPATPFSHGRTHSLSYVAIGTLVDDPTIRQTKHIFVGSKAPFTITDDLPNTKSMWWSSTYRGIG